MTGCNLQTARSVRRIVGGWLALSGLLLLGACGGAPSYMARSEFVEFSTQQKTEIEAQVTHAYRIQEGDLLKIHFAYEKNLNQDDVVVLSDGAVSLVGIDRIRLAGLTISEADSVLTLAYSREYREPALSVMMEKTQGRRVYVLGEVRDPGVYAIPLGGQDVMSAIAMASGFTEDAARDGTLIVRVTRDGYQFQEIDLKAFGTTRYAAQSTVPLQTYDIVYVPRTRVGDFAYFTKNVLAGIGSITRIAYDLRYVTTGKLGGY